MKRTARTLCLCLAVTALSCSEPVEEQGGSPQETEATVVTPKTDLDELKRLTSIAGQPEQVWWLRTAMGHQSNSDVPGPTDIMLQAIIDYGSADAVSAILGEKRGTTVRLVGSEWYPEIIRKLTSDDARIDAEQYIKVEGFDRDARISVPAFEPGVIILQQVLG